MRGDGKHAEIETQPSPNLSTEPGKKGMVENAATETQPAPNLSTEHQKKGDARSRATRLIAGHKKRHPIAEVAHLMPP